MGCTISVRFGTATGPDGVTRNGKEGRSTSLSIRTSAHRGSAAPYLHHPSASRVLRHVEDIVSQEEGTEWNRADAAAPAETEPLLMGADRKYLPSAKAQKAPKVSKQPSQRSKSSLSDLPRDRSDTSDYSRATADRIVLWLDNLDVSHGEDPVAAASKARHRRSKDRRGSHDSRRSRKHRVHLIDAEALQDSETASEGSDGSSAESGSELRTARSSASSQSTRSRKSCISARSFGERSSVMRNVSFALPTISLPTDTDDPNRVTSLSGDPKPKPDAPQPPSGAGPQAARRRIRERTDVDKSPRADIAEMLDNAPTHAPSGPMLAPPPPRKAVVTAGGTALPLLPLH